MPRAPGQGRKPRNDHKARRLPKIALRNWRVRSKLLALIVIPTVAALILGGTRVTASMNSAIEYQRVNETAVLAGQLAELAQHVELERDLTATYVAQGRRPTRITKVEEQYTVVDKAIQAVRGGIEELATSTSAERAEAVQIRNRLDELPTARTLATGTQLDTRSVVRTYQQILRDLIAFNDDIDRGAVDEELAESVAAFAALSRAKEHVSTERALLMAGLSTRRLDAAMLEDFLAARAQRDSELATFRAHATIVQRQVYEDSVSGQDVDKAEAIRARALVLIGNRSLLNDPALGPRGGELWFKSMTVTVERMRKVEAQMAESIILRSRTLESAEQRAALIAGVAIVILLLLVLAVTIVMARSLVRPLRRLRGEALHIAGQRLPDTVRQLRQSESTEQPEVVPIGVMSQDEIGEVARAFDEVHREAVRLAGEESRLRSNVNAMFVNLSRRSQTLVERQITLIDGLEQGEQDESRLANLFKLDHLATRMRRNSENLLVLAGQDPPRRWSQPVKLVDVARASLSEVENYERVLLQVPDGVSVAGQAVNDVIHLLAELVENALSFSPREARVTMSGSRIDGGGVMLSISDSGIGMTHEELVQANERLAVAPSVDVSVSRRMGLFVVSRLAHRHGIRVQLRPQGGGGLTAMVLMPETLLGAQTPAFDAPAGMAGMGMGTGMGSGMGGTDRGGMNRTGTDRGGRSGDAFAPAQPVAPSPSPWQGGGGYQMGPAHPSYPPNAEPSGSWPSADVRWPTGGEAWQPDSRGSGGGYDTDDVWIPSRVPGSWSGEGNPLPKRSADPLGDRNFDDRTGPGRRPAYDFPETEAAATGPIPAVTGPPSAGDEFLPIFAAVESAWFEHSGTSATWGSANADAGWSAAQAAAEPIRDGATASGLPKRVPKANLVPGSADTVSAPKGVAPMPAVSPDRVRSRLSSFQKGFRAARDDLSGGRAYPSDPRNDDSREEGA